MTEKSASDVLCELLDERGVEYEAYSYVIAGSMEYVDVTRTRDMAGRITARFMSCNEPGKVDVAVRLTPEQAIAATLGRSECEVEYVPDWMGWHCKSCDTIWQGLRDQPPKFCKNCGKAVKR